jgi:DNA-binding LacI/PurR family transcriptional regulator
MVYVIYRILSNGLFMSVSVENRDFLYNQVQNWLLDQIRLGRLKPGSRLPGERSLAKELKISRSTARLALQKLEAAGTIERIPSKGAFLTAGQRQQKLRLVLIFSESEISLKELAYSNWASTSEIQRGALSACETNNATLTFQYAGSETLDDSILPHLTHEYDGALFIGDILSRLRERLVQLQFPCFTLTGTGYYRIDYDHDAIRRAAAQHLYDCGCRQVYLLTIDKMHSSSRQKINALRNFFDMPEKNIIDINQDEERSYKILKQTLAADASLLPDAFFCGTQVGAFALLRLAQERGWRVPKDFMIMGYANNMDIRPTNPPLTHVKIPYWEIGRTGAELFIQSIINGTPLPDKKLIAAELIIGKTTKKRSMPMKINNVSLAEPQPSTLNLELEAVV